MAYHKKRRVRTISPVSVAAIIVFMIACILGIDDFTWIFAMIGAFVVIAVLFVYFIKEYKKEKQVEQKRLEKDAKMPKISLEPANVDPEIYESMARTYVYELAQYCADISWSNADCNRLLQSTDFILGNGQVVGFITAGLELVQTEVDGYKKVFHIRELYIEKAWRGRGIALEAVKQSTRFWNGEIALHILNKNQRAKSFWGAVADRLGWQYLPDVKYVDDDWTTEHCEQKVYKPRQ